MAGAGLKYGNTPLRGNYDFFEVKREWMLFKVIVFGYDENLTIFSL